MNLHELAKNRRSIRKYEQRDVDTAQIVDCVRTAVTAPSGCNSQCWKFIIIHNKEVLDNLAGILVDEQLRLFDRIGLEYDEVYIESRKKMLTFFANAPVCVAVFMTDLTYYDRRLTDALTKSGIPYRQSMELFGNPDILSVGAAVQNFLLAVHEKGLGACWMNDPVFAHEKIEQFLGMEGKGQLVSLIPVGYSAYTPRAKKYKAEDEILQIIE